MDWFQILTGPAGTYGYTLEFYAGAEDVPDDVELRVQLVDESGSSQSYMYVGGPPEDEIRTCWSAQRPETHLYLEVTWGGSISEPVWVPFDYRISFASLPIQDTNELDNSRTQAKVISLGDRHNGSYLCSIDDSDHGYHVVDWYALNLSEPVSLAVTVQNAGLDPDAAEAVNIFIQRRHAYYSQCRII